MAFIREKEEIKTGFQEIEPWSSEIDLQTDFVMVYGLNESLESRMQQYSCLLYTSPSPRDCS